MPGILPLHDPADQGLQRIDPLGDCPSITVTHMYAAAPTVEAVCDTCQGAGWVKEAVPYGHPHFGVLFPCACMLAERSHRKTDALVQLSNLDAFREKTFATFNPFIVGLRTIVPQVRT